MFVSKIGAGTSVAVAALLGVAAFSGAAQAGIVTTGSTTTYATQGVTAAAGAVTVPAGITYTSTAFTTGAGGDSFLLTVKLPTGVTFASVPTATVDTANFTAATQSGGGSGQNTVIYTVTVAAGKVGVQGTVTLGAFQIAGATALGTVTATGAFEISFQGSGAATTALNDASPAQGDLGLSKNALKYAFTSSPIVTINVASPSNATKVSQAAPLSTSKVAYADLGEITTQLENAQNAAATALYTFNGTTTSVAVTGSFTGVSNAYIAPPGTIACATSFASAPSGSITGSIAGNTISFTGVGAGFDTTDRVAINQELCVYFTGTTVISANNNGVGVSESVDTTTVSKTGPIWSYDGSVQAFTYSGNFGSSYTPLVRIVNNNAAAVQVTAVTQSDSGSTGSTTVESSLAANNNDLVPASTIFTNSGVTLPSSGRGSLTLLGPNGVAFSQLLVNPDGTVNSLP